jgi:hypothetical protein
MCRKVPVGVLLRAIPCIPTWLRGRVGSCLDPVLSCCNRYRPRPKRQKLPKVRCQPSTARWMIFEVFQQLMRVSAAT